MLIPDEDFHGKKRSTNLSARRTKDGKHIIGARTPLPAEVTFVKNPQELDKPLQKASKP